MEKNINLKDDFLQSSLHSMILSASGWRALFNSQRKEDAIAKDLDLAFAFLTVFASNAFSQFLSNNYANVKTIVLGRDTRPTGEALEKIVFFALKRFNSSFNVLPIGYAPIPEVINYAKERNCAFFYISASHNPIGYNGFKFGIGKDGVFEGRQMSILIEMFKKKLESPNLEEAYSIVEEAKNANVLDIELKDEKVNSVNLYFENARRNIASTFSNEDVSFFWNKCKKTLKTNKNFSLHIICDFNGSSRSCSIDKKLFESIGASFYSFNNVAGDIVHGIIPEGENLEPLAKKLEECFKANDGKGMFLGYMPDCDGDRGNVVYLDKAGKSHVLRSQEVFCLAVVSEVIHSRYLKKEKIAVIANGPTSLLLDEVAKLLSFNVFRAEVGEANVVNLAKKVENKGFYVRILGEGSNGGCIIPPALVRDPLNTLFALLKFFLLKDDENVLHCWQEVCKKKEGFSAISSFEELILSLPRYSTTPVAEKRAILKIRIKDAKEFRSSFQRVFVEEWSKKKEIFNKQYGFESYKAYIYAGDKEVDVTKDFASVNKGGFKIIFYDEKDEKKAFIWMRPSGTEPVFRIMADIKGGTLADEMLLLEWETCMIISSLKNIHL